jgi:hypothetical protein
MRTKTRNGTEHRAAREREREREKRKGTNPAQLLPRKAPFSDARRKTENSCATVILYSKSPKPPASWAPALKQQVLLKKRFYHNTRLRGCRVVHRDVQEGKCVKGGGGE